MRVLSWNVARRRDAAAQVSAIAGLDPDVVVLQEVTGRSWSVLRDGLARAGLTHAAVVTDQDVPGDGRRSLPAFVATASRLPLTFASGLAGAAPGAVVVARVACPGGPMDVIGVHIPTSARHGGVPKLETQEALIGRLADRAAPTVVMGDFNSPRDELPDGSAVPFARPRGSRAWLAEVALVGAVTSAGLRDAFRLVHGQGPDERSWYWKNRGKVGGYRLDHVFACPLVAVRACEYVHGWRVNRLSDHSAIWADLELPAPAAGAEDASTGRRRPGRTTRGTGRVE